MHQYQSEGGPKRAGGRVLKALAYPRGMPGMRPLSGVNFCHFHTIFSEIVLQIIGWHPHLWIWHILWEILNPPVLKGTIV